MVVLIGLLGLVVPIFNARPILVMIISQALSSVLLPLTTASILYLTNKKSIMKEHTNKLAVNIILVVILLFSLFNSYTGLKGVGVNIGKLKNTLVEEIAPAPTASLETQTIKF
jgi:Mn2+/Fe2+ NRAMP family transporter